MIPEIIFDQLNCRGWSVKAADEIMPNTTFEALGADSLDIMEIIMTIEERLDITIEDDDFGSLKTVRDLITIVEKTMISNIKKLGAKNEQAR